jgi:hypothetical protein
MACSYDAVFIVGCWWSELRFILRAMYTVDYTHFEADKDFYYKEEEGNVKGNMDGNVEGNGFVFVVFVLNGGIYFVVAFGFVVQKLIVLAFYSILGF